MLKDWLFKKRCEKHNIQIVEVSDKAVWKYKNKVRGNYKENAETSIHKILRNWNSGRTFYNDGIIEKRAYGNLTMILDIKTNTITNICNHFGNGRNPIDTERRELVSKVLGLA